MITYTVMLHDYTIGTIYDNAPDSQPDDRFIGEFMQIDLHGENGNPITHYGWVAEILAVHEGGM